MRWAETLIKNFSMFQIIFNDLSSAEMSNLPKDLQLDLLAEFQFLPEDLEGTVDERFGVVQREGKKLFRFRAKDYRIYFEKTEQGIKIYRVLHKNTIRDFLFRANLPMAEEDALGKSSSFWKLIEEGESDKSR